MDDASHDNPLIVFAFQLAKSNWCMTRKIFF